MIRKALRTANQGHVTAKFHPRLIRALCMFHPVNQAVLLQ